MIKEIWNSWWFQNLLVVLLLAVLTLIGWRLSRREYWRLAYREVRQRRGAVICFFVLCLYVVIALADSVGWRRALKEENGEIRRNPETGAVVYDRGASALDYLLKPLSEKKEKTYSAPMADVSFMYETATDETGVHRVQPKLKYPGQHWLGTDRIGMDVFVQALKSIRTGMVIGILTTLLAVPFALFSGVVSGYMGGFVDDALQYVCTVFSSVPTVLFIAAFMLIFGTGLPQLRHGAAAAVRRDGNRLMDGAVSAASRRDAAVARSGIRASLRGDGHVHMADSASPHHPECHASCSHHGGSAILQRRSGGGRSDLSGHRRRGGHGVVGLDDQ